MWAVRKNSRIPPFCLLGLLLSSAQCSHEPPPTVTNPVVTAAAEPCGSSSIKGVVTLQGFGRSGGIDMSRDPVCDAATRDDAPYPFGSKLRGELVVVNKDSRLANALIFLKGQPLDSCKPSVPTESKVLTFEECRFSPHVIGIQKDQLLELRNNDRTDHQFCAATAYNEPGCINLGPGETNNKKKFSVAERFIPISCACHTWERAYLAVFDTPFFAVTDKDGYYEIKGIPPGEYTVVHWHEYFGERTSKITVEPNQVKTVDFTIDDFRVAEQVPKSFEKSPAEMMEAAVRKVELEYPEAGARFGDAGQVEVRVMLDEEGNVTRASYQQGSSGGPLIWKSAEIAALGWKFKPTIRDGVAVKVMGSIFLDFKAPAHLSPPSTTHYDIRASDKINQYFGPITHPFSLTLNSKMTSWNPSEPLTVEVVFKNTTDKILLLDIGGLHYFTAHLTARDKSVYGIHWDKKGAGNKLRKEDYTELKPGASHTMPLTSTRILDRRDTPWSSHKPGNYKLEIFYVNPVGKPAFPGEWIGQAISNAVTLRVDR